MNLEQLQKAGFSDQEVREYVERKAPTLKTAGFSEQEINTYFGSPVLAPAEGRSDPPPFDLDKALAEYNSTALPDNFVSGDDVGRALSPSTNRLATIGYSVESAANRALAGLVMHLDLISDFLTEKTGMKKGSLLSDTFLKDLAQNYEQSADRWKKRAEEAGAGFLDEMIGETIGGLVPGAAQFAIDLGSGLTFPAMAGAQRAHVMEQNEFLGAITEAGKTGALAGILKALHPLKLYLKAPAMGGAFGIQAAGEGAEPREIAKSFGVGAGLAAFPAGSRGARMGLNEIIRDFKTARVKRLAEMPWIEPTVEQAPAKTRGEEERQPGGAVAKPAGVENESLPAASRPGREIPPQEAEGISGPKETAIDKKTLMADPDWTAGRQKGDQEAANRIVEKAWQDRDTESVRLNLSDPGNALYLTIPRAAPAKNSLPGALADRLARDLGGEVIDGADYIKPLEGTEQKKGARGVVISYPKGFEGIDFEGLKQKLAGKEVVVVDDTGRAVRPFLKALVRAGVQTKTIAYLMKPEPSRAVMADEKTITAFQDSLDRAKIQMSAADIARGMTRSEVLDLMASSRRAKTEEARKSLQDDLQNILWDKTGIPAEGKEALPEEPEPVGVDRIKTEVAPGLTFRKAAEDLLTEKAPETITKIKESVSAGKWKNGDVLHNLGNEMIEVARERNAAGEDFAPLLDQASRVGQSLRDSLEVSPGRKTPKETENLVQWVRDQGGIWDPSLKGEVSQFAPRESGVVGLVSKKGKAFDEITKTAIEDAWLPEGATSRDFLDLLRQDVSGAKLGGMRIMKQAGEYSPEMIARLESLYEGRLQFAPKAGFRREREVDISPGEITGRADILRFLRDKLGIPIRSGRFREKALGIFKVGPEVIRTRNFADIEAISHEVGHGLQKFLWPETFGTLDRDIPLAPFTQELGDLARGVEVRAGSSNLGEGFAEFIRLYVTDGPAAERRAPHFYSFFDEYLNQRSPESREVLLQARGDYDRYMTQPAYQRVRSQISIKEKPDPGKTWRDRLDDLYTMTMDEFHPLLVAEEKMTGGEKVPVAESPYGLARLFNGWIGKANSWLKFSPFEFKTYKNVGESLEKILKPVADNLDEFSTYMVARRVPGLLDREIDVGISRPDAEEVVRLKDQQYPQFRPAFDALQQYQDHLLSYLRDSGILAEEIYTRIREVSKDYDPFYRVFEESGQRGGGLGRGFEAWQPVKEIRGGWERIQDPIESIIKNTMLYTNLAERNAVGQALVKLAASREGLGKFVEEIPERMRLETIKPEEIFRPEGIAKMKEAGIEVPEFYQVFRPGAFTPRENVIAVWIDGVQREYQVTPDIWRVIKSMDREGMNALEKLAAFPARWLRAGSVLTPEFIARNPARDMYSAFINTKYGFIPGYDLIRGIFHFLKKDEHYWNWQKSGGATSTLASMDRDYLQDRMGEILQKSPIVNLIKNPVELLRSLGEITEAGTRLGEFLHGEKKLGTEKEALQAAGFSSRELTVDFQRVGAKSRAVNSLIAFFNANNQGIDRTIRQFRDNPGGASLRVMASITLPSLLLSWANNDDPRYWEVPQWQRDLCWIIIPNHMNKEKWDSLTPEQKSAEVKWFTGSIYRFPKPWIEGVLFGSVPERILQGLLNDDPDSFKEIGNSLWRATSPGVVPNILVPWLENKTNYSLFFDRRIVPENRKDLPPEFQYGPYTTDAAKKLGELLGKLPWTGIEESLEDVAAPAKIENLVRGWTGGLGYYAMQLASAGMRATGIVEKGPEKPASTLADIPLIKAFVVRYPQASTESISQFYENYRKSEADWKAINALVLREGRVERALELMQQASAVRLGGFKQALDGMHGLVEMIYRNPTMTPEEKAELVDVTYFQMIEIAKGGNQIYKEVNRQMKAAAEGQRPTGSPARITPQSRERKPLRSMPFVGGP